MGMEERGNFEGGFIATAVGTQCDHSLFADSREAVEVRSFCLLP